MNEVNAILNFTDSGLKHIQRSIDAEKGLGFRLNVKKTGCSGYAYITEIAKNPEPGDIELNVSDVPVFIAEKAIPYIKGTVIDFIDQGLGQTKLVFHNPNAANLCGCGESFNLLEDES